MTDEARRPSPGASGLRASLTRSAGRVSRGIHGRCYVPPKVSGAVRLATRRLAASGTYTYRDYHGNLVEADLADYMERAGFFGAHSSKLVRFITSHLGPGDWAIDAGANVGLLASAMSAAVGPKGCVWAVEPVPRNIERLQSLKEANGLKQLEIKPFALSSERCTAPLRLPALPGGSGFGSFVATWERAGDIEVEVRPLDELVGASAPDSPLRLVKMDVEGFEGRLLAGARETLTGRRPLVICEIHDPLLRSAGTSADELVAQFGACGYAPSAPFDRPSGSLDGVVCDMLFVPS
jgi:FkbM family methyltransferase